MLIQRDEQILIYDIKTCNLIKEIECKQGEDEVGWIYGCAASIQQNCLIVNFGISLNEFGTYVQTNILVFYELETFNNNPYPFHGNPFNGIRLLIQLQPADDFRLNYDEWLESFFWYLRP